MATGAIHNPQADFEHYTVVINEVLALSDDTSKPIKEAFFSLLSPISLLGRATKVHCYWYHRDLTTMRFQ